MKFLHDTNTCIQCIRGKNAAVTAHFMTNPQSDLVVCSVVVGELLLGVAKIKANPAAEDVKVRAFLLPYKSLPFDDGCAEHYAKLRADLERRGLVIGANDMLIAAIALAHGLTLVTHNTREFTRVVGLSLVDWEVP